MPLLHRTFSNIETKRLDLKKTIIETKKMTVNIVCKILRKIQLKLFTTESINISRRLLRYGMHFKQANFLNSSLQFHG